MREIYYCNSWLFHSGKGTLDLESTSCAHPGSRCRVCSMAEAWEEQVVFVLHSFYIVWHTMYIVQVQGCGHIGNCSNKGPSPSRRFFLSKKIIFSKDLRTHTGVYKVGLGTFNLFSICSLTVNKINVLDRPNKWPSVF